MWLLVIYIPMLAFFIFKMCFYSAYVSRFPDEIAHVSYIAYLDSTKEIVPNFRNMRGLQQITALPAAANSISAQNGYSGTFTLTGQFNYLCHPPLYYQVMRLAGGIHINSDGSFQIDLLRLRIFSMFLAVLALLLLFYIGFTRLGKNPFFHLLYAVICVSVPMLAYASAGVNNDTMSLLVMSVFLFGMLRFAEKKRNLPTYLLLGFGVFGAMATKTTAALIALITLGIYLVYLLITEKNLKFLLSRPFLLSTPLYLLGIAYYAYMHLTFGTFSPDYHSMAPAEFLASGLYVEPSKRVAMTFLQFGNYFISNFLTSWTGIFSYVSLLKPESLFSPAKIGLELLPVLPVFLYLRTRSAEARSPMTPIPAILFPVTAVVVGLQFMRAYVSFLQNGYLAGWQSRYYLCVIGAIALAAVLVAKKLYGPPAPHMERHSGKALPAGVIKRRTRHFIVNAACCGFSLLLIYEDFVYFLLNFKDYLK